MSEFLFFRALNCFYTRALFSNLQHYGAKTFGTDAKQPSLIAASFVIGLSASNSNATKRKVLCQNN